MGRYVRPGVGAFYAAALLLWSGAIWQIRPQGLAVLALLPVALQLMWQVGTLKENGLDPLVKFRSNRFAGLLMFLGCLVVGSARSEEHTSELQSLMRISYAVFCLKKKKHTLDKTIIHKVSYNSTTHTDITT